VHSGLKRSTLVSSELEKARNGNILSRSTLSLFYATDFADQVENIILPALKAGSSCCRDRYIYTLMARDMCGGMDEKMAEEPLRIAPVRRSFYLSVETGRTGSAQSLEERDADYWESGWIWLVAGRVDSFLKYQTPCIHISEAAKDLRLDIVDASRPMIHHQGIEQENQRVAEGK